MRPRGSKSVTQKKQDEGRKNQNIPIATLLHLFRLQVTSGVATDMFSCAKKRVLETEGQMLSPLQRSAYSPAMVPYLWWCQSRQNPSIAEPQHRPSATKKNRTCEPIHPLRTRRRALDAAQHQPLRPPRGKWAPSRAQTRARARAWAQVWRRARHHRSGHVGYLPEGSGHVSPVAASEGSHGRRPCPALPVRLGEEKQGRREHWESGATRKAHLDKGLGSAPGCLRRVSTSS